MPPSVTSTQPFRPTSGDAPSSEPCTDNHVSRQALRPRYFPRHLPSVTWRMLLCTSCDGVQVILFASQNCQIRRAIDMPSRNADARG